MKTFAALIFALTALPACFNDPHDVPVATLSDPSRLKVPYDLHGSNLTLTLWPAGHPDPKTIDYGYGDDRSHCLQLGKITVTANGAPPSQVIDGYYDSGDIDGADSGCSYPYINIYPTAPTMDIVFDDGSNQAHLGFTTSVTRCDFNDCPSEF